MPIIYTRVCWKDVPLCDYSSKPGTFRKFCDDFSCVYTQDRKKSVYRYMNYNIFVYITDTATYISIATSDFQKDYAFVFLMKLDLQFKTDFEQEIMDFNSNLSFPLRYEMDRKFSSYISHSMNVINKAAAEKEDIHYMIDEAFDEKVDDILDIELDEEKTRTRLKHPLLVQSINDIKSGNFVVQKASSSKFYFFTSWLMKHSYISIGFCIAVGVGILAFVIFKSMNKF